VVILDLAEARRLISEAGYRPYIRKVKGKAYITLKRGSREVGVGPFTQDVWDSLVSQWDMSVYGSTQQPQPQKPTLNGSDASLIFQYLSRGYDAAQVVEKTLIHPDVVKLAAEKYMELKGLKADWLKSVDEALKLAINACEAYRKLVDSIMASSAFKRSACAYFERDKEVCTLEWDPSIVDSVKAMKLEGAQPFTVVERVEGLWGGPHVRIKPTPLWCLACPYFERRT
jgi:hypothetical protein